ncbi:MAG: hypothetical protein JSU73_00815, partial [candidate division WOR-3 bacterium]
LDFYDIRVSDAMAYGGSGHAFLINIHEVLCPSSPYVWKYDGLYPALRNLGIEMTDLGFYHTGTPADERAVVEARLQSHLDSGNPCSLANMEHQVIYGYDDGQFFTAQPWPANKKFPPATLSFGDWTEFGKEVHVNFFTFGKLEKKDDLSIFRESLRYGVDLFRSPDKYQFDKYAVGFKAYDNWAAAAKEHGGSHGNWWNATVWSECRSRASEYLAEMARNLEGDGQKLAQGLTKEYADIAGQLSKIADKEMPADDKAALARELKQKEEAAIAKVEQLAGLLG